MKNINYLIAILLLTIVVFSGCKKIKEIADVEFNADYNTNLNIVIPPESRSTSFEVESTINPNDDEEVQKYLDKIKKFEVQQIKAEVIAIDKSAMLETADLDIFSDTQSATWHMENLPLAVGEIINLGNENGQWNTLNQIFSENKSFTIKLKGEIDEDDLTFTLKITIVTKITANPL